MIVELPMASFYEQIISGNSSDILLTIAKMCDSGDVSAYLFRRLSVGSVFFFVDNITNDLTVIVFGYERCLHNKPLEEDYIEITTVETMELIRISESTKNYFSSITGIAAIQVSNNISENKLHKVSDKMSELLFSSDIQGETVTEMTETLVHFFHAIPTDQSIQIFQIKN